jgi:hypothetical protein
MSAKVLPFRGVSATNDWKLSEYESHLACLRAALKNLADMPRPDTSYREYLSSLYRGWADLRQERLAELAAVKRRAV